VNSSQRDGCQEKKRGREVTAMSLLVHEARSRWLGRSREGDDVSCFFSGGEEGVACAAVTSSVRGGGPLLLARAGLDMKGGGKGA